MNFIFFIYLMSFSKFNISLCGEGTFSFKSYILFCLVSGFSVEAAKYIFHRILFNRLSIFFVIKILYSCFVGNDIFLIEYLNFGLFDFFFKSGRS